MFIKYINQVGEVAAIYNSDDIESIGRNTNKKEIVIKFKNQAGTNGGAVARLPMNNLDEVQKVIIQFAELLEAKAVTSEITETENLEKIL